MNENDIEILLYRILSGHTIFFVNSNKYKLLAPDNHIKYEASLLYENILNEEKYHEWLRADNITNIMISLGVWTFGTDKQIKDLETKIDDLKVDLFNSSMNIKQQQHIRNRLKSTKYQLGKILQIKNNFITNTLEGYANSLKNEYIICNTLYDNNDKLIFNYDNQKSNSASYSYFNSIITEIDGMVITTEQFKKLARHTIWRSYWNVNKSHSLFDKNIKDWTDEQRALVNISKMYDNIYEHPECPNDSIIDDDDMLDGWMIIQKRKAEKDRKQKTFDAQNPHLTKSGEVFLFAKEDSEVKDILSLNSDESRKDLQSKLETIKQRGTIEDGELPDVQRDLKKQLNELNKQRRL